MSIGVDGLSYRVAMELLEGKLLENKIFSDFENIIGSLAILTEEDKLCFSEDAEGYLASEVLFRILDEGMGFLGCVKQGGFYASLHHLRSLIELFAVANYSFSQEGYEGKMSEAFVAFKELRRHLLYLDEQNSWGFSDEQLLELKKYKEISQKTLNACGYKDIEEDREKL